MTAHFFFLSDLSRYRAAEKEAQLKKLRLWRDYEIKEAVTPAGDRQFKAVVQEIISPEQLVVRNERGSRRIHLASLRQPKAPQADNAAAGEEVC